MTKHFTLLTIIFAFAIKVNCQNINLIPLYTTPELDLTDGAIAVGSKLNLVYVKFLYNSAIDSNTLINNDTTFYEVRQIDLQTGIEKKYQEKYKTDTTYWPTVFEPFYNKYNNRIYLNNCKLATNTGINSSTYYNICKQFNVVSYDTNLLNRKSVTLPVFIDSTRSYRQANKLIYKDSFIYAISCDTNLDNPYLCKIDLHTGLFIDSLKMANKYTASFYKTVYNNLNLLNDSTLVCLSNYYVSYINLKTLQLIDTFSIKYDWQLNKPRINEVKFSPIDTSYVYNGNYSGSINQENGYFKINAKGFLTKLFDVPIDQNPAFYNRLNGFDTYHWDFMYPNHIYTAIVPIYPQTDTFAICHSNIAGITDWIKLVTAPDTCIRVTITAMADSSVVGVVTNLKSNKLNANDLYDSYYFKVDQYGKPINAVGIKQVNAVVEKPILYPNPCSAVTYIANANLNSINSLYLLNSYGQVIKKLPQHLCINTSDIAAGIYFVSINTKQGNSILKFVKQ